MKTWDAARVLKIYQFTESTPPAVQISSSNSPQQDHTKWGCIKEARQKSYLYLFPAQQASVYNNIIDFEAQTENKYSSGNPPTIPKQGKVKWLTREAVIEMK